MTTWLTTATSGPPLVGRDRELAALVAMLEETLGAGVGGAVVLEGEPGAGKSRLVLEALHAAQNSGFHVVVGSAEELWHDRPLGPIALAFGLRPDAEDADAAEIGRMLGGESSTGADPAFGHAPDEGFRIVEAVVGYLERLAAERPLLLALEDLHWADPLTLRAIRAIIRSLADLPVAVVLSLRPWPRSAELDRVVSELVTWRGCRLHLKALASRDAARLAEHLVGTPLGPRLTAQVARAGGNPLFVIELVRALQDEGAVGVDQDTSEIPDLVTPATLQLTFRARIGFLPDETVEVLRVASVLGERFAVADLAAAMSASPVQLLSTLAKAVQAELLTDAGEELAFRHELVREAIYAELPVAIRKGLHREAARVLAGAGAPLGKVADHLVLGATAGDPEAVDWLVRTARQVGVRAPATAIGLLERAMELTDPADPSADALACDLAPLLIQTGRAAEAQVLSGQALDRGPVPAVEAALRRALGEVLWTLGWLEAAVGELEAAAAVPGIDERERVGPAALAAHIRMFLGQATEAEEGARRALRAGRALGDDVALCLALQTLAVVADARGDLAVAIGLAEEAAAVAVRSPQARVGHLNPHLYLGLVLLDADRLTDAEAALQQGRRHAEARGAVLWLPLYHCVLAITRFLTGEWDDALAEVDVGLAVADEVGTRLYVPFLYGIAALVAIERGDLALAKERLDGAVQEFLATTTSAWQAEASKGVRHAASRWPLEYGLWIAARLHEARGDGAEALRVMEDAWAVAGPLRYFLAHRFLAPDLVRLALAAGSRQVAAAVTAEITEGARRSGATGAEGAAMRCRGLLDDDPDCLLGAVDRFRRTGSVTELACALEEAGATLARARRPTEAVAALEEALALTERAGAARVRARIEAALRTLGVHHRRATAPARAVAGWESLTPTELAVAALAAEGLTNRQAGERLFVSRRTVETHLAHVYGKLGISSRAELAAEVGRRSL